MSEVRKGERIEKWDEVTGTASVIEHESTATVEDVGAGPSISRNYLRGVEDQVEQNDNSFDGIINNTPPETVAEKEQRTSIKERLNAQEKHERKHKPPVVCRDRCMDGI